MPELQMPKLSDTMTEGTLVAWKKKKGDQVSAGEVIAEIETDKATMEWESPEDGTLTEIFVEEGGKVEVGQKIAFIGEKEAASKGESSVEAEPKKEPEQEKPAPEAGAEEKPAPAEKKEEETAPPPEAKPSVEKKQSTKPDGEQKRLNASPVARRLAVELGVELGRIKGTGPEGRITEADVRSAAKSKPPAEAKVEQKAAPPASPKAPATGARLPLTGMRKIIAARLVESKGPVPHFYLNIDLDATALVETRSELKAAGEDSDTAKITVNDFILKAAVEAAVKVPKANATFDGDATIEFEDVDLAVAVAIEDGLVTPVIRAAQKKSLRELSETMKDLAHRARNKRMKPEEFQGGSFTVSNLGGYGIDYFSAIINPPQSFILSVGAIRKRPAVDDCDQIVVRSRFEIGMSCDHRVIDGALGAEYLKELRRLLENPTLLLL